MPVAAAIDVASLPSAQQASAQVRLDVMQAIVGDLPADPANALKWEWADRDFADLDSGAEKLSPAQGKALRAVRQIVLERTRSAPSVTCAQSKLSPVTPCGFAQLDYCEYDPGLPALPYLHSTQVAHDNPEHKQDHIAH